MRVFVTCPWCNWHLHLEPADLTVDGTGLIFDCHECQRSNIVHTTNLTPFDYSRLLAQIGVPDTPPDHVPAWMTP